MARTKAWSRPWDHPMVSALRSDFGSQLWDKLYGLNLRPSHLSWEPWWLALRASSSRPWLPRFSTWELGARSSRSCCLAWPWASWWPWSPPLMPAWWRRRQPLGIWAKTGPNDLGPVNFDKNWYFWNTNFTIGQFCTISKVQPIWSPHMKKKPLFRLDQEDYMKPIFM